MILFGILIFLAALGIILYLYLRDRRREKSSVVETMGDRLWDEIARERDDALLKSKKFKQALEQARHGGTKNV